MASFFLFLFSLFFFLFFFFYFLNKHEMYYLAQWPAFSYFNKVANAYLVSHFIRKPCMKPRLFFQVTVILSYIDGPFKLHYYSLMEFFLYKSPESPSPCKHSCLCRFFSSTYFFLFLLFLFHFSRPLFAVFKRLSSFPEIPSP